MKEILILQQEQGIAVLQKRLVRLQKINCKSALTDRGVKRETITHKGEKEKGNHYSKRAKRKRERKAMRVRKIKKKVVLSE